MNRSERRRKERQAQKKTGLSAKQIAEIKEDATNVAFDTVFSCLFTLPFVILHNKYGFGEKRLKRFNDELVELLKDVEDGKVDLQKIKKELEEKYNITYRNEDLKKNENNS